jgi:hypothetical protein
MMFKLPRWSSLDVLACAIAVVICALVGLAVFGMISKAVEAKEERMKGGTAAVETYPHVKTIQHDNHLFVLYTSYGIIHHPSCPCLGVRVEGVKP